MLKHTLAAVALTLVVTPALAQSNSGAAAGAATGAGVGAVAGGVLGSISAQDRTYVREYVVQHKRPSARVKGEVVVGATLPQQVAVYPVEGNPAFSNYRYTYVNDRAVLIDPSSRRVVYVIE
jgi:hypothetical protein